MVRFSQSKTSNNFTLGQSWEVLLFLFLSSETILIRFNLLVSTNHNGDLNTRQVYYLNGPKLSGCQMVLNLMAPEIWSKKSGIHMTI